MDPHKVLCMLNNSYDDNEISLQQNNYVSTVNYAILARDCTYVLWVSNPSCELVSSSFVQLWHLKYQWRSQGWAWTGTCPSNF